MTLTKIQFKITLKTQILEREVLGGAGLFSRSTWKISSASNLSKAMKGNPIDLTDGTRPTNVSLFYCLKICK